MAARRQHSAWSLTADCEAGEHADHSSGTTAEVASITANAIDFWNRLSQQMAYIDSSTRSSSLGCGNQLVRCSSATEGSSASTSHMEVADRRSLGQDIDDGATTTTTAMAVTRVIRARTSRPIHHHSVGGDDAVARQAALNSKQTNNTPQSVSWTNCACSYCSAITQSLEPTPPRSPLIARGRSVSCNQNQSTHEAFLYYDDLSRISLPEDIYHQCAKLMHHRDLRLPNWQETTFRKQKDCCKKTISNSQKHRVYTHFLNYDCDNDDNDDCDVADEDGEEDEDEEKEDLEMELLQPLSGGGRSGQDVATSRSRSSTFGSAGSMAYRNHNPSSGASASTAAAAAAATATLETMSMGGGARRKKRRLRRGSNYSQQPVVRDRREGRFLTNNPSSFACYGSYGMSRKKASSSWEESETVQRRRSLMLAANMDQCPSSAGTTILLPTPSQLDLLHKRDLRYYFQHPYPRLFVTYFVIFCNFLLFAEDPISHSHTESDIPMVGNVFSFVVTKYPPEWPWTVMKVLMWVLAMLCGMIVGKIVIHGYLCGRLLRLKMFRDDQGSWMTMFMTVIVSLYIFHYAYNLMLLFWYHDQQYQITSQMAVTNASVMKAAACGTWLGDLITALMVTDMMLQDNLYPTWATSFRAVWRRSNIPRILIFWVGSVLATSIVVTLIVSDWISWDKLNKDFISTNEVSRAFLASFILVMDLLIVMQDWDFPNFTTTLHVNLPGMNVATLQWKYAKVAITGKWFNYGIIFLVMMLDLNMWKNQIFYEPKDYGQYTDPDDKVYTLSEEEVTRQNNASFWTWEYRSTHCGTADRFEYEDDMLMNSRYVGYPLSAKWTAFIPSVVGLVLLVTLVTLYGRFPSNQSHPRDRPLKQFRDKDGKQQELLYCVKTPTNQLE